MNVLVELQCWLHKNQNHYKIGLDCNILINIQFNQSIDITLWLAGHLCCWSIEEIVRFIIYFGSPSDVPSSLPTIAEILVYCNCCVNPLILLASYAEFRRTVYANFRRWLSPFMSKSRSVSNGVQEQQQRSSSGAGDGPRRSRATAKDQLTTHLVDQVKVSRMEQDVITPPSTSHS